MKTITLELTKDEVDTLVNLMENGLSAHIAFLEEILHPDEVIENEELQLMQEKKQSIFDKLQVKYHNCNPFSDI
jgi:hypothetical protein